MKKLLILLLTGSLAILPIILEGQERSSHTRWLTDFRLGAGVKYSSAHFTDYSSNVKPLTAKPGFKIAIGASTPLKIGKFKVILDHEVGYQSDKLVVRRNKGKLILSQINLYSKLSSSRPNGLNGGIGVGLILNAGNKLDGDSPVYYTSFHSFSKISAGPVFALSYRKKQFSFSIQGLVPINPNFASLFPPNAIPPGPKNPRGDIHLKILSFDGSLFYYF